MQVGLKNSGLFPRLILTGLVVVFFAALSMTTRAFGQEEQEKARRIEGSYSYESLDPGSFGNWHSGSAAFYSRISPRFTYFIQGSGYHRNEGNAATASVGAYKDWTDYLYTYTAVSGGTNSVYVPRFRGDNDFNFKIGPKKNVVATAGMTYVSYSDNHRDFIISGGPTVYFSDWVLQYRLFYNESNPGSVTSFSHLVSVAYGREHWQWTTLNVSFGKQAYLATSLATPESVNNDSYNVELQHRHWLAKNYGIIGGISCFKLQNGYKKLGATVGAFYEF